MGSPPLGRRLHSISQVAGQAHLPDLLICVDIHHFGNLAINSSSLKVVWAPVVMSLRM